MSTDTPPQNPAGNYVREPNPSPARRAELFAELAAYPDSLRAAVAGLSETQLDTKYRNWTLRQIVHHVADSHAHAYIRFKWALTEDAPTIKAYDETAWSALPDALAEDIALPLAMLAATHARWVSLLRRMTDGQFSRTYVHPEYQKTFALAEVLAMYAWHGRHHAAQIAWRRERLA